MMLKLENTGLIIVDVQGKLARLVDNSESVINNIAKLIQGAQALSVPVVCLEQYPQGLGETVDELRTLLLGQPIAKTTFSGWGNEEFRQAIHHSGRKQWLICGIETHVCVYQTAMDMLEEGYQLDIVEDAVSSRTVNNRNIALQKLASAGAGLSSVEMALYELVGDSSSAAFKAILPIVR
jgi:nicotinamidase-related amidase